MAKISARGDSVHARWRHPESGAELVLTMRGRLLSKPKGGSWTMACSGRIDGLDAAQVHADRRGMERVR